MENGKLVCDKCNGTGKVTMKIKLDYNIIPGKYLICPRCGGSGKLDWIDRLLPNKMKIDYENYSNVIHISTPENATSFYELQHHIKTNVVDNIQISK